MYIITHADIDECLNVEDTTCHIHATCENSFGGFICKCDAGFTGSGSECYGRSLVILPYTISVNVITMQILMNVSTIH